MGRFLVSGLGLAAISTAFMIEALGPGLLPPDLQVMDADAYASLDMPKGSEIREFEAGVLSPGDGFALVELFTSEGCSSCPPADEVGLALQKRALEGEPGIIPLSFHVDYWNRLGWKDPFSQDEFTHRQQSYANARKWGVYTPQMVVNGDVAFVGSQSAQAYYEVKRALKADVKSPISLSAQWDPRGADITVTYRVANSKSGHLHVALAEMHRQVKVKRGENGGKMLRHGNIVRAFTSVGLGEAGAGALTMALPPDIGTTPLLLVAYFQGLDSGEIDGANWIPLGWPHRVESSTQALKLPHPQ